MMFLLSPKTLLSTVRARMPGAVPRHSILCTNYLDRPICHGIVVRIQSPKALHWKVQVTDRPQLKPDLDTEVEGKTPRKPAKTTPQSSGKKLSIAALCLKDRNDSLRKGLSDSLLKPTWPVRGL